MGRVFEILNKGVFHKSELIELLLSSGDEWALLLREGARLKKLYVDKITYFRGLVELSNICSKNCLYCGIRSGNSLVNRYSLSDEEVIESVKFAHKNHFASVVLQSGEISSKKFSFLLLIKRENQTLLLKIILRKNL